MGNKFIFRRHYPTDVQFWLSEEPLPPEGFTVQVQLKVMGGSNSQDPLDYRIQTNVVFSGNLGEKQVARGSITFVGFFTLPDELSEEARSKYAVKQGASLLYSATRELVCSLSARAPNRLITLPPVVIGDIAMEKSAEQIESATV